MTRDILIELQGVLAHCEWPELAAIAQRAHDEITELREQVAELEAPGEMARLRREPA